MASGGYTPDNFYPMSETYLYTLVPGTDPGYQSSWADWGAVLKEHAAGGTFRPVPEYSYPWVSNRDGTTPANHLWAPTAARGADGNYYLFVPDVSDPSSTGVHTSSHIGVSMAADPRGPFNYLKQVTYNGAAVAGYASDPAVMATYRSLPGITGGSVWLVWANGDYDSQPCGGFTIAQLDGDEMTTLLTAPAELSITGLPPGLDKCPDETGTHAYMEGADLYDLSNITNRPFGAPYLLMFAIKPNGVPSGCSSDNEAIAYATANDPRESFTYRGIIMCGSSTQWTNQASIYAYTDTTAGGSLQRFIIAYHDAATSGVIPQNRHVHFQCLTMSSSGIPLITRDTYFSNCMGTRGGQFEWRNPITIR
jgi:hypothetical protein